MSMSMCGAFCLRNSLVIKKRLNVAFIEFMLKITFPPFVRRTTKKDSS